VIRLRESFGAKLLAGLLGTVGVLFLVTFLVVRTETDRQVEVVARHAVTSAETQFRALEEFRRRQADRFSRSFVLGRRTLAALDEAVTPEAKGELADLVAYELQLATLEDVVVAFCDGAGDPVLTLHDEMMIPGEDPLEVRPLAASLLDDASALESHAYRVFDSRLYSVRTYLITLGGRAVGTVSLGLPITPGEVSSIGDVLGVELCLAVDGACVVGTPRARGTLSARMMSAAMEGERVQVDGRLWSIQATPLSDAEPGQGSQVVAIPLDEVLAPFERIRGALLLGGGGSFLLAIIIGTFMSRSFSRPMRALVAATERVAQGDFHIRVQAVSRDEVGNLAHAFNQMTEGLLLKERYRSVLDKVVSPEVASKLMSGEVELGGETRMVTVLFADIRGFTELTEGMPPQRVINLLNEIMQHFSDAVERAGGVVDKYVGDELMAVFGVPVAQGGEAARALGAARMIQEAAKHISSARTRRGDHPISVGVGVHTGIAVAGNMGSRDRLNYTVVGGTVNLAARLCKSAVGGQILCTGETLEAAGDAPPARSMGSRPFKGFTSEVEVYSVETGIEDRPKARPRGRSLAILLAGMFLAPAAGHAQGGEWPTLAGAGLEYVSPSGFFQIGLSGQLDIEALHTSTPWAGLVHQESAGGLAAHRLRIFTDVFVGDNVYGLIEFRSDRGHAPSDDPVSARIEQAYLRFTNDAGSLGFQVGLIPAPFGSYSQRHLTTADPFLRPPLPYDYHTVLHRLIDPRSIDGFLSWRDDSSRWREPGVPPLWDVPYQWGGQLTWKIGPMDFRLAGVNSAPSSEPDAWYDLSEIEYPSWVLGTGITLSPSLRLGLGYNRGPWTDWGLSHDDTPGATVYHDPYSDQEMFSADFTFARGPVVLRGEAILDRWEIPGVPQGVVDVNYTVEGQVDLAAGIFLAARVGYIDFRPVTGETIEVDWDYDVARYETSLGYRLARNAGVLVSAYSQVQEDFGETDTRFVGARLWWAF